MIGRARRRSPEDVDLTWIDGFVKNVRPHLHIRVRDSMLILMPNQAYHLNESALYMLRRTLSGDPIAKVLDEMLPPPIRTREALLDVEGLFRDLRSLVMGCLCEGYGRRSIEHTAFQRVPGALPVLSEVAVTYRCNLSCKFCYAGCTCAKRPDGEEMSIAELEVVLRRIRSEAEVPSVSFTGGEPTIRADLPDIVRIASSIGLRVNLITSGTLLTDSMARKLKKAGLRSAQVSLEAPESALHDAITTVPGSFERTLRGIAALKRHGVYVHTNTTMNRMNVDALPAMADLAKSLGFPRLSMNMVMPCGSAQPGGVSLRYSEVGDLVAQVKKRARAVGVEFMWYSPTPYCLFNPIASGLGGKACAACNGLLSVAPNGDVLPCSSLPDPVGNILRQGFDEVWQSERAVWYRSLGHAPSQCKSCESFDICSGACPIYWDAFGCGELPPAHTEGGVPNG